MNERNGFVDDRFGDVFGVRGIDQIQDLAMITPGEQIFGMIFWGCFPPVSQSLPMIGFFTRMNDLPVLAIPHVQFVIGFRTDMEEGMYFEHEI